MLIVVGQIGQHAGLGQHTPLIDVDLHVIGNVVRGDAHGHLLVVGVARGGIPFDDRLHAEIDLEQIDPQVVLDGLPLRQRGVDGDGLGQRKALALAGIVLVQLGFLQLLFGKFRIGNVVVVLRESRAQAAQAQGQRQQQRQQFLHGISSFTLWGLELLYI